MKSFFDAVEAGRISEVRSLLNEKPSLVDATDTRPGVSEPRKGWVLLEARQPRPSTRTALHIAAIHRRKDVAQLLISRGATVDARDWNQATPLHFAVRNRWKAGPPEPEFVRLLITSGASVNARTKSGTTPLHNAISLTSQPLPVVEVLLASGADVNAASNSGWTPLYQALWCNYQSDQSALVATLIAHGADVNPRPPVSGISGHLLNFAVGIGRPQLTRMLIAAGAEVNANSDRGTALHTASRLGYANDVELLLAAGADPGILDHENRTALDLMREHEEMIAILDGHVVRANRKSGTP